MPLRWLKPRVTIVTRAALREEQLPAAPCAHLRSWKNASASTSIRVASDIPWICGSYLLVRLYALGPCVPDPGPWRGGPTLSCDRGCPDPTTHTEVISRSAVLQLNYIAVGSYWLQIEC